MTTNEALQKREMVGAQNPALLPKGAENLTTPFKNAHNDRNDPLSDVERRAEIIKELNATDIRQDLQRATSGVDTVNNNRISTQKALNNQGQERKKQEAARRAEMMMALQQRYDNAMADLDGKIEAADELMELIRNGEFDGENDEHKAKLRTIFGEDMTDAEIEAFCNLPPEEKLKHIQDERNKFSNAKQDVENDFNKADELDAQGKHEDANAQRQTALDDLRNTTQRSHSARDLQKATEHEAGSTELSGSEVEEDNSLSNSITGSERKISTFMKGIAQIEKDIDDPMEKLAAEKQLIEELDLSEDACFELKMGTDTAKYFEEGHFDALKDSEAEKIQTPIVQSSLSLN